MTQAVCINCGCMKFGALTHCPSCKFRPETLMEIAASLGYSDHHTTASGLDLIAKQLIEGNAGGEFTIHVEIYTLFAKMLNQEDQSFRDIFVLKRDAKRRLFRKEVNCHVVGLDGYKSEALSVGKDIDRATYRTLVPSGGNDIFAIETWNEEVKSRRYVPKNIWYIAYDQGINAERRHGRYQATVKQLAHDYAEFVEELTTVETAPQV